MRNEGGPTIAGGGEGLLSEGVMFRDGEVVGFHTKGSGKLLDNLGGPNGHCSFLLS